MAERENIRSRLKKHQLTQVWLINQLGLRGIVTDKTEMSSVLARTRSGSKADAIIELSHDILDKYEEGSVLVNRCTTNPARTDFIKKVQKVCALYREGLMQDGKVNPVTGIFWQKNYDGMKDQTEMVLTPNNPLGDSADTEALARKYLDNADIVDVPEGEISEVAEGAESHKIK